MKVRMFYTQTETLHIDVEVPDSRVEGLDDRALEIYLGGLVETVEPHAWNFEMDADGLETAPDGYRVIADDAPIDAIVTSLDTLEVPED